MSWSVTIVGRASKVAEKVKETFEKQGGCPAGTAEEAAKNALGGVAETLSKGFLEDPVVRISAQGSAWTEGGKARQQFCKFEFETLGAFVE